ncbi:glycosyltransferase family 2 protein [Paraburkholderia sediminicola]|uniref:glycosyltransferase family 2 protein n=1 Tax=Paraburkholderia sediminicola TaxID=458836 RepID=UPI0038B7D4E8
MVVNTFISTRIAKAVSMLRLRWTHAEFSASTIPAATPDTARGATGYSHFGPVSALPRGWYMVELRVKSSTIKIRGTVASGSMELSHAVLPFEFPIHAGRTCKRVVRLERAETLQVSLNLAQDDFQVEHFTIARLTESFSRSRILRKLIALHPAYKKLSHRSKGAQPDSATAEIPLSTLWTDYCDLFEGGGDAAAYREWVKRYDTPDEKFERQVQEKIGEFDKLPLVSVLMPVYNPEPRWLEEAILSVTRQHYPNWELCIADDASSDPRVAPMLTNFAVSDPRIKVVFRPKNGHISAASNSALELARGDWIALLDNDDVLPAHALFWLVDAINRNPGCQMVYSDEDKIDADGARFDPYFKSDWNPDLFYSQNLFSHLGAYRTQLVRDVGGFRLGFEGSQDHDLALRCMEVVELNDIVHVPRVLYHWRVHENSTAHSADAKPYAALAAERALNDHFRRTGVSATAEIVDFGYRVRYPLPEQLPLVSLIIPTRDNVGLLKRCITSILSKTVYFNYEVLIVNNGSRDGKTLRYLDSLKSESRINVIRDDRDFNYSALNNATVKLARGEVIALVNDDVEVISPDWLAEMVSHALRPGIGAVGARLLYPNGTIQHGGIVLGVDGVAGHAHRHLPGDSAGYCGRAGLIQSFSAVTGACLVIRKSIYENLGGLNETDLPITGNDVDFCLRVMAAGYLNVWTPYAELFHHESATRGVPDTAAKEAQAEREAAYMRAKWSHLIEHDRFYSPNLAVETEGFELGWPPRVPRLPL